MGGARVALARPLTAPDTPIDGAAGVLSIDVTKARFATEWMFAILNERVAGGSPAELLRLTYSHPKSNGQLCRSRGSLRVEFLMRVLANIPDKKIRHDLVL